MNSRNARPVGLLLFSLLLVGPAAQAQDSSISTQCPDTTDIHPTGDGIKCGHVVGGDGFATMASDDARRLYIFSFAPINASGGAEDIFGLGGPPGFTADSPEYPGWVMANGTLAANAPAPTIVVDEDDELFLTMTNVGMAMRPDLFDPHSIHWHGFPNASAIFDGVPDASISINMGASLTYYYYAKDAGTYMYHCHVEATEHMQMGMLGNLYVRPRQNKCDTLTDDAAIPGTICPTGHTAGDLYAYNDGDGSTRYDVEVPIQIGSFDPTFHDASETVQPLPFVGMRDTYYLLNGRGYPDTVNPGVLSTADDDGEVRPSQPVSSLIEAQVGQKVLVRLSNLNVTNFYTLGTSGLPMKVIALDARRLVDDDGNNMYYDTHSLTLGGGMSADVLIDTTGTSVDDVFFLYTTNLHQLANDSENFGGMMTEIRIVP